ncbi:MAG TPA: shikimate kinase [Terracidiphilus sp.]|nr:shikimate kinase [Terracidiphilus sp.]
MTDLSGDLSPGSSRHAVGNEIHRIVLTGFMGAGKSTVGLLLAEHTGWDFLDLDTHMETTTKRSARALFEALGETGFRQLESDLWASALRRSRAIIAPGGAVIDKAENQSILAESVGSFIVFLDAPFQTLIDRCLQQERQGGATYRPLLHKNEIARARYMERRVLYANHAQQVIDVANHSPKLIAQEIWRAVFELR